MIFSITLEQDCGALQVSERKGTFSLYDYACYFKRRQSIFL